MKEIVRVYNELIASRKFQFSGLALQSFGNLGLKIAETGLRFVSAILIARLIGADGYGTYGYILSWVTILTLFGTLGFGKLLVREVSNLSSSKNWSYLKGLILFSNRLVIVVSVLLLMILMSIVYYTDISKVRELKNEFYIGLLAIPLLSLIRIRQATLQGLKKTVLGNLSERLIRPAVFILILVLWYFLFPHLISSQSIITAYITSLLVAFIIGAILLKKNLPLELTELTPEYNYMVWVKSAFPFILISGMRLIHTNTDILMIGSMMSSDDVGIYMAALRGSELTQFVSASISTAMAPNIAAYYSQAKIQSLQKIVVKAAYLIFALTFPMIIVMIFFGNYFLGLFGSEFYDGHVILIILCGGQMVNAVTGSVVVVLTMTKHTSEVSKSLLVSAVVNILLNYFLIQKFGLIGSGIATASSFALWNVMLVYYAKRKLNINATIFQKIQLK